MKFNWFRICTAYRRPMTSRPNMVTKVIVRYASHWKRNCKLKSQRHEKDTSVERKKKKKKFSSKILRMLDRLERARSVLRGEINTMEGFGIGSKVVKPVSNYERDGLTDGS